MSQCPPPNGQCSSTCHRERMVVVIALALVAVLAGGGIFFLAIFNHETPRALVGFGGAAVGALASWIPRRERD